MSQNIKCSACGRDLELEDGYMSCPVYMAGESKDSDEHTSRKIC